MSATPHIITPAQIQSKLTEALQAVFVEAKDMSDGCKCSAHRMCGNCRVVSDEPCVLISFLR